MGSIRKGFANLGLVVLTVFVLLLLLEGGLRFTSFKNLLSFSRSHVPQYYYRTDPVAGYDIKENFPKTDVFLDDGVKYPIWSNELGCFDDAYKGEKGYILLVGDSFTHAFAPFGDKWGTGMESHTGTRVLKCGVSGYGTKQEALKADSVCAKAKSPPQLIVVGYTMNDFMDDYLFPQYSVTDGYHYITKRLNNEKTGDISTRVRSRAPRSLRIWLKKYSILYNLSEQALKRSSFAREEVVFRTDSLDGECTMAGDSRAGGTSGKLPRAEDVAPPSPVADCKYPWLREAWKKHGKNIASFRRLEHAGGAKVLFVIIPVKEQVYPFLVKEKDAALDQKYAIVLEIMKKEGIPHLDLLPLFRQYAGKTFRPGVGPKNELYWTIDGHWNVKGNHLAGLLVSEHILDRQMIDVPDRESRLASIRDKLKTFN
jgi:hypothetical protein